MTALTLKRINKAYGSTHALRDIDLSLEYGEVVALLGPNGSGKTTAVKCIASLIEPDHGEIYVGGRSIDVNSCYLANVGAVLEGSRNIHWRLTVSQNARYFAGLRGPVYADLKLRMNHLADVLGLSDSLSTVVGKLSTGNRQKVSVLCALIHNPSLILMDEPTLGLDIDTVKALCEFIVTEAKRDQRAFLITSHDLQFIDNICDRVIVIHEGSVLFDGLLTDLKSKLFQYEAIFKLSDESGSEVIELLYSELLDQDVSIKLWEGQIIARYNETGIGLRLAAELIRCENRVLSFETGRISMEKAYRELLEGQHASV